MHERKVCQVGATFQEVFKSQAMYKTPHTHTSSHNVHAYLAAQPSTARPSLPPFHARKSKNKEAHYTWGKVYGETYGSGSSEPCGADVAKVVSPPSPSNSLKE